MTSQRSFLLGLLFLGALGILGYYTLFLTDFTLFGERHPITVHFAEAGGHAMHGSGMGTGMPMMEHRMPMGQGMEMGAMMQMRQPPAHIGFDRVPGKMVPRIHRAAVKHCPMCPFGILTQGQREQAHELLGRREPHQHQG